MTATHPAEERPTIRDLCRRWRYSEAKLKADEIILDDDDEFNRRIKEVSEEQLAIEGQIVDADPDGGAYAAAEILRVVLDLVEEHSVFDGRDTALLRKALTVLAWAEPGVVELRKEKSCS